jgi:spore maturation protein CgeB
MKIGFYLRWDLGSLHAKGGNVLGDELYATSLVRALNERPGITAQLYAPNHLPETQMDFMVYMNDNPPRPEWGRKSVLYLQNAYGHGADQKLAELRANGYDGYAFISQKLRQLHNDAGFSGIFLPFGVDISTFNPKSRDHCLSYEVSYVGNDIKGRERTEAYLQPATEFNFGLYGNWKVGHHRLRFWKNWFHPSYRKRFEKLSCGKIPQEMVPVLYSSSKINLNCTAKDCVDWDVITLRTLEVLACDGFLISDRVPSAEALLGDYVAFTDGHNDLTEKIRYYLANDGKREEMARAGGEYVRNNFSVTATADNLLNYIEEF